MSFKQFYCWLPLVLSMMSCSSDQPKNTFKPCVKGEYIYRLQRESFYTLEPLQKIQPIPYPWEKEKSGHLANLTKAYFRCKGSSINPLRSVLLKGETVSYFDCGGAEKHSLPLKNEQEFIYPILINLLNFIQNQTGKRVIITSGHRCPEHNTYVDPSPSNQYSKHMIGAAVSFYVQDLEDTPEASIKLIQLYYKTYLEYKGLKEFEEFQRYQKEDTDVTTQPWYNKEVFIKLYQKKEGRDFDNRHPYPYINLQVRYDRVLQERVSYTYEKAYRNYLRH